MACGTANSRVSCGDQLTKDFQLVKEEPFLDLRKCKRCAMCPGETYQGCGRPGFSLEEATSGEPRLEKEGCAIVAVRNTTFRCSLSLRNVMFSNFVRKLICRNLSPLESTEAFKARALEVNLSSAEVSLL